MKKVLSVAMASAMVLGMGANAFAIQYSTGSNDKADWPSNFKFDGELFVTNKDGDIIEEATTAINDKEYVDFEPGDVIWMPLYANNQKVYSVAGNKTEYDAHTKKTVSVPAIDGVTVKGRGVGVSFNRGTGDVAVVDDFYLAEGGVVFAYGYDATETFLQLNDSNLVLVNGTHRSPVSAITLANAGDYFDMGTQRQTGRLTGHYTGNDGRVAGFVIGGVNYDRNALVALKAIDGGAAVDQLIAAIDNNNVAAVDNHYNQWEFVTTQQSNPTYTLKAGTKLEVTTNSFKAQKASYGKVVEVNEDGIVTEDELLDYIGTADEDNEVEEYGYNHYTGNIDKNWSINLIEKSTGVAELIEKAELYKADQVDYLSYRDYTDEIMPNAVYLKVTLKKEWKTTTSETLKYYVYIADNKSNKNKTNEVWVSGKYANTDVRPVSFDWTNDASKAGLWKVKEGNGIAVFDFADKAFFSVKMYEGETMYLDLKTAYDKAIAGEMDAEADSFYKFDNTNANFARTGELLIVSDDSSLVPYQIDEDGNFVAVDAEYVENYAVAHTNKKVNGFVFNTKQLGNYVLSTEELGEEEEPVVEEPAVEEPVVEEPAVEEPAPETNKPNPNTGAEDFVGLAVSLAVVSVAAAGALALKK
ncbi:MAG: hypothetical protein ACLU86_06395 [Negativibacillus massiliensis]|uniref:hypothetical protein n=1 Tax=Negativibacillus massiliensis TaxID=1871035 RepID=UPI00399B9D33